MESICFWSLLKHKVHILTEGPGFLTLPRLQWPTLLAASFILCFHCSLSSSGAMWPGIKTETGLPEAPSGGQPGFLSFSTAYTSTQPGHLHYSYPSQGKLRCHSVSQDNAVTLSANMRRTQEWRRTCTALFSSLVVSQFKYRVEILLFSSGAVLVELFLSPGSSFTTSSVYSSIPSATAATTTSTTVAHQVS